MKPHVPDWLLHLLQRPAAVLGHGVSGKAAAGLITALGGEAVIFDRAAERAELRHFGADDARRFGLVVVSPGFAAEHEWLRTARNAGCEILAELDLGALAWPGEIIAVTGTNGKTTITEFLTHALRLAGRPARTVGNIGEPFCDAWRDAAKASRAAAKGAAVAVCEVSSFQAELLRFFEASASLWTNFAEDHLERHHTLEAYFRAKYNLVKRTRGRLIFYGPTVLEYAREFGLDLPLSQCVRFEPSLAPLEPEVAQSVFGHGPQRENYLLVRALWRHLGLPDDTLVRAAATFRIGAHRLARVAEIRGVTFWNDSKATNFHAVEAALAGFERPVLLIAGGRAKGGDVAAFVHRIAPRVRQAFVIGETAEVLQRSLRAEAVPVALCASLREAVTRAFAEAASGDHVLLSPAFASFDMFTGYDDRGRRFEAAVAELAAAARESPASFITPTSSQSSASAGFVLL